MTDRNTDPFLFDVPERSKSMPEPSGPDFRFETQLRAQKCHIIAGTDEVGRGPLAGPVVAAAVVLSDPLSAHAKADLSALNDSKKLTKTRREALFETVHRHADAIAVCSRSALSIDGSNILQASLAAMRQAVISLPVPVDGLLVDGNRAPGGLPPAMRVMTVVGGDGRSMSIAAASIIAKVTRDRMMEALGAAHPDYGLDRHAGYGSKAHRDAIANKGGIERVHRFSFRPLRKDDDLLD